MLFPLHLGDPDDPAQRELAEKSFSHWLTVDKGKALLGWSGAAAGCIYARPGRRG